MAGLKYAIILCALVAIVYLILFFPLMTVTVTTRMRRLGNYFILIEDKIEEIVTPEEKETILNFTNTTIGGYKLYFVNDCFDGSSCAGYTYMEQDIWIVIKDKSEPWKNYRGPEQIERTCRHEYFHNYLHSTDEGEVKNYTRSDYPSPICDSLMRKIVVD